MQIYFYYKITLLIILLIIILASHLCPHENQLKCHAIFCLGSVVVSVMDSHSCDRGSSPGQVGNQSHTLCSE